MTFHAPHIDYAALSPVLALAVTVMIATGAVEFSC